VVRMIEELKIDLEKLDKELLKIYNNKKRNLEKLIEEHIHEVIENELES